MIRKNLFKTMILGVVLTVSLSMAACGNKKSTDKNTTTTVASGEIVKNNAATTDAKKDAGSAVANEATTEEKSEENKDENQGDEGDSSDNSSNGNESSGEQSGSNSGASDSNEGGSSDSDKNDSSDNGGESSDSGNSDDNSSNDGGSDSGSSDSQPAQEVQTQAPTQAPIGSVQAPAEAGTAEWCLVSGTEVINTINDLLNSYSTGAVSAEAAEVQVMALTSPSARGLIKYSNKSDAFPYPIKILKCKFWTETIPAGQSAGLQEAYYTDYEWMKFQYGEGVYVLNYDSGTFTFYRCSYVVIPA